MHKKCYKCNEIKYLEDFPNNKSKNDGKSSECKICKQKIDKLYRDKNKEKLKNYFYNYNKKHKEELSKKKKIYNTNNKEKIIKQKKKYYQKNKEKVKEKIINYKKNNKHKYQLYSNSRRSKKVTLIDKFTYQDIIDKYGNMCFYCQGIFEHIDHYIPLSKGGLHNIDNVRPSCKNCNLSKGSKLPEDFLNLIRCNNE